MDDKFLEKEKDFHDDDVVEFYVEGLEECDGLVSCRSEFKSFFEKLAERELLNSSSRQVETQRFIQSQCYKKLTVQNVINLDEYLRHHCHGFADLRLPHIHNTVCTAASQPDILLNLRCSKSSGESLRARSTRKFGNLLVQYVSAFGPENVILRPSGKWLHDSIDGRKDKGTKYSGSSLVTNVGDIDSSSAGLDRLRSANSRVMKSTKATSSQPAVGYTLPQNPREEITRPGRHQSGSKMSDQMLVSCSSVKSNCSFLSEQSEHAALSKGLLHCIWKSGVPCFAFSVADNQEEVYFANLHKAKSVDNKALDCMYLFHLRTSCNRGGYAENASHLVAKMKVLSCLAFDSDKSNHMESEFVLFGSNGDRSRGAQKPTSSLMKRKGLTRKVVDKFRINHSNQQKSIPSFSEPSLEFKSFLQEHIDELYQLDESDHVDLFKNNLQPGLGLAAIVIKNYKHKSQKEVTVGGWGLRFLQKFADASVDSSCELAYPWESCHRGKNEPDKSIDVLIPAGFHGYPVGRTAGPSSLIKRWRSGGHCDCGGWDVGCPLTVLNNRPIEGKSLSQEGLQGKFQGVDLFVEGTKQQPKPALKMERLHEGVYIIYFQSNLSALQTFSIGVAILHTQTPASLKW